MSESIIADAPPPPPDPAVAVAAPGRVTLDRRCKALSICFTVSINPCTCRGWGCYYVIMVNVFLFLLLCMSEKVIIVWRYDGVWGRVLSMWVKGKGAPFVPVARRQQ